MAYQRKEVNRMSSRNDHDSTDISTVAVVTSHANAMKHEQEHHEHHDHHGFSFHNYAHPKGHLVVTKQYEYYYNKITSLHNRCKNKTRSRSISRRGAMSTCTSYESKSGELDDSSNHVCEERTFENQKPNEKMIPLKSNCSFTSKKPVPRHDGLQIQNRVDNHSFKDDGRPNNIQQHFLTLAMDLHEECSPHGEEEEKQDDSSNLDKQFKDDFKQKFMSKGQSKRSITPTTNHINVTYDEANTNVQPRKVDKISEMRNKFRNQRPRAKTESDLRNLQFKNDFKEHFLRNGSRRNFSQSDSNFSNTRLQRDSNPPEFLIQLRKEFHHQRHASNSKRLGRRGAIS